MPENTNPHFASTFAERRAAREASEPSLDKKVVKSDESDVEDKAIKSAESKKPAPKKKA